jgi:serine/threonine-protein kinase
MVRVGETVGRFRLLAEIDEANAVGALFEAADEGARGRRVAVQLLPDGVALDERGLDELRAEAGALAQLHHPSIITVLDLGPQLFVLEPLGGVSLRAWLADGRKLRDETVRSIVLQLASAVAAAHSVGVVHRDLKPGTVVVRQGGSLQVAVIDFGVTRLLAQPQRAPAYLAPEQCDPDHADKIGPKTDVYALGVIAYELLIGRPPFDGDPEFVIAAHQSVHPIVDVLPPAWQRLVERMLAKRPSERPSMNEVIDELQRAELEPMPVDPWDDTLPRGQILTRRRRRLPPRRAWLPLVVTLVAAVATAAAGLVVLLARR